MTPSPAAHCPRSTSTSSSPSPRCTPQQAAAAWAWFEHAGGSTPSLTPRKSDALLPAAPAAYTRNSAPGASRFKKELHIPRTSPAPHHSTCAAGSAPAHHAAHVVLQAHSTRRHSFHNDGPTSDRLPLMSCRFSSAVPNSPSFSSISDDPTHQNVEEGRKTSSSLFDKFEVEAVCKQLHDQLIRNRSIAPANCSPSFPCHGSAVAAPQLKDPDSQQAAQQDHPQAHLKRRRYFKSSDGAAPALKPFADHEHHHNIHADVLHRLLHLRIKTLPWGRSTSAAPALCSSVATANSIVDPHRHHHRSASAGQFRAISPYNHHTTLKPQDCMQSMRRVSSYSGELKHYQVFEPEEAADEHERGELTSKNCKSRQKMRELERIRGAAPPASKMHGDRPWRDDNGVAYGACRHYHVHEHHHIHHHHHLQNKYKASQDALLLQDIHAITNKKGAQELRVPKIYSLRKEEFLISPYNAWRSADSSQPLPITAEIESL